MNALLYAGGVLAIVVGLAVSIALHECGHMIPARRFGARVPQFFVGFGPTIWSRRRGGTEYGIKAIPLGGFVKIIGMLPPQDEDARPGRTGRRQGPFAQLIADARAAEADLLVPGDENRMFYRLAWWKKVIVMAGGPTVNLVIAFLLFGGLFAFYGVPEATTTVRSVPECVVAVRADEPTPRCTDADPIAPSRAAGIEPGDTILAFGGTRIEDYEQLQQLIRANGDRTVDIVVQRDGAELTLQARTAVNELPSLENREDSVQAGYLGIEPTQERVRHGLLYTAEEMVGYVGQTAEALVNLPVRLWGVAKAAVGIEERDPESPMSVVGVSRVAGEVAASEEVDWGARVAFVISLLAGVNLFLGMFNFVPLLPLDGGHIAGALVEAVRRGWARLRGRPDPGYFDVARLLPVAYVVAGLLLAMTVVLVYADVVAPIS